MNYKEHLKTMIGRKGTLIVPKTGCSHYILRYNEQDARQRNAYLVEVEDDYVMIHHDVKGMLKIPLSSLW